MAHEISIIDGLAEAAFANSPAWHGLGAVFQPGENRGMNSEQALELAHLNWRVEKQPIFLQGGIEIPGSFATVRMDINEALGIVGDRYEVQQNHECFEFLDSLCQDGIIEYESAFALNNGRKVVILARMPSFDEIAEGDNSLRYVLFSTSHDGTGCIDILPTSVRVVCANTLRLALGKSKTTASIRHTAKKNDSLKLAKQWLSQFDDQFTLFRDSARILAERKYSMEQAREYIHTLFPMPTPPEGKELSNTVKKNVEEKRAGVYGALHIASNSLPSIDKTWWQLLNAVTYNVDHESNFKHRVKDSRSAERAGMEKRFDNSLLSKGAELKDRAFNLAVAMSA